MTIGPAPMIRIEEMSVLLGIASASRHKKRARSLRVPQPAPGDWPRALGVLDQIRWGGKCRRLSCAYRRVRLAGTNKKLREEAMQAAQKLSILRLGLAFAATTIGVLVVEASAQTPPADTRPVTLVVPIAAGGGVDIIGRQFAAKLSDRLGQPWLVENRTGAGGAIGADTVAKATPDGHTVLLMET